MSATISLDILARDRASSVLSKVGASADKSGTRISKMHGTISRVARSSITHLGALAGIAGIGAVVKSSIELEAQFGKTMNLVRAASGAPQSSMKAMTALAMKMGAATQFSANEAADAMLELAKAGISTKDIMGGGLKNTLLLASAGQLDLGEAATIASNSMNMFNLHGKDMGKIAAALAGGANKSTASVGSLGQALSQVGPGARNAGLSLNETVGVLAAFDQAGIKGSDAGTSLKTMLARLVPQTTKAKKEMQLLGLSFVDAHGNIDDVSTVAQKLHDKLGPLTQAQRAQALQTMFGSDATRAATVLMNQGAKGLAKFIKATKDQGAAQRMSRAAMSGTAGALERLRGATDTAKLALGQALAPTVRKFANYLSTTAVPKLTKFIGQMQSGKGTGGAVARDLNMIFDAGKKVVGMMGDVAKAVDSMPSWAKKTVGVAAIAGVIGKKTGLLGGFGKPGGVGGVVQKATGVIPVFVTNFGKGGIGPGGVPILAGGPKGPGAHAAEEKGLGAFLSKYIAGALLLGTKVAPFAFGGSKDTSPKGGDPGKQLSTLGALAGSPKGAQFKEVAEATQRWDKALASLAQRHPDQVIAKMQAAAKKTGFSFKELAQLMPKTASAVGDFSREVGTHATHSLHSAGANLDQLKFSAQKAGVSARQLGRMMGSLPSQVVTKLLTPGAVKSKADMRALGRQYGLTPKQVRTLIQLLGFENADGKVKKHKKSLHDLNGQTAKPRITPNDADVEPKINKHKKSLHVLNGQTAKPKVTVDGGQASATLSHIQGQINGIHGKSVTITTTHRAVFVSQGNAKRAEAVPNRAGGGLLSGPGTDTSDSIPAMLSNNEYVVRAAAVRKYGVGFFDRANALRLAKGGHAHHHKGGRKRIHLTDAQADLLGDLVDGIEHGRVRLNKAIAKVRKDIGKQADKISNLLSSRASMVSGFQGFHTSVFNQDFGDQPITAGSILAMAKQGQASSQTLQSDIGTVIGKGLSKALVKQFSESGETGIAKLHALAGASAADIAQLNSLDKATTGSLAGAGKQAGGYVYNASIRAAKSQERMDKRLEHLLKEMRHGGKVEVHVHLTGQEIIRTVRAEKKKHGQKSAI